MTTTQITPAFLTEALRIKYPATEVELVSVGRVNHGTGTTARLMLEYNDAGLRHRLPTTMCIKGAFESARRDMQRPYYRAEAGFYAYLAPELEIDLPLCYFAASDDVSGQAVVLLEDLLARPVTFGRVTHPVEVDTVASLIDVLAKIHARWWQNPALKTHSWLADLKSNLAPGFAPLVAPAHWAEWIERRRAVAVCEPLRKHQTARIGLDTLWDRYTGASYCFLHGDAHIGNTYFELDSTPGLIDWQICMIGSWAHDVTYLLVSALSPEKRSASERELLEHYLSKLQAYHVEAPSFDEAWTAYRDHVMYGYMWIACPPENQPEDVIVETAYRFAVAAEELDTVGSLGLPRP